MERQIGINKKNSLPTLEAGYFFSAESDDGDEDDSSRVQTTETAHPPQDLDLGSVQEV